VTDSRNSIVKPRIQIDAALATITAAVTVPDAPTNVVATAGNASASIAFSAPGSDGGAPISSYTAACTAGVNTFPGTAASSPVNVTGLTNATQYSCTVRAWNSAGGSLASAAVLVTPTACTYALGTSSSSVSAALSLGSVSVTATPACSWTAVSNVSWIAVTLGASGSGSGSVGYSVAVNTGATSRIGTLTVATRTFTVTQAGTVAAPVCTLLASPAAIVAGGSSTLTANCSPAATSYNWTGGTCGGSSAASCTVTPAVTTTYTVAGINTGGTGTAASATVSVSATASTLSNVSTRGFVGTGDNVLIGGFIISGNSPQRVLIKARGPSMTALGVPGVLANPVLQLFSGQTVIASNDDWGSAANAAAIQATGLAPTNALESAILITLNPGPYTAIVTGSGGTTGVAIVEVLAQ
jgi:hypothetical protein